MYTKTWHMIYFAFAPSVTDSVFMRTPFVLYKKNSIWNIHFHNIKEITVNCNFCKFATYWWYFYSSKFLVTYRGEINFFQIKPIGCLAFLSVGTTQYTYRSMRRQHYSCVVPRSCTVRKIHGKKSVVLIERVCMHIRHTNSYLNLTFSPSLLVFCLLIFVNSAYIQWYCGREQAWVTTRHLLPCTVRKFNWWRYFLALCD